ncbi:hypothetical protein Sjap_004585 [Stephania japonica]|uniref:Expansin-like B1 n=1 Tax=Stephania japonica TaxID=461633 RepID=A0AAP0PHY4_9MAGN
MDLKLNLFSSFALCFLVLLPVLCLSGEPYTRSRAGYYKSSDGLGTPSGECGYGEFGRTVNRGLVATVSDRLYRNGTGCGACYKVRCTIPKLCSKDGVTVVATDEGKKNVGTDFILSPKGFTKLALPDRASELKKYGVVDIEYQRIPCKYPGHNLMFRVHELSDFPDFLAMVVIYKGGISDITAIEVLRGKQWESLRNAYGALWDITDPPRGPLTLRIQVMSRNGVKNWFIAKDVLPTFWDQGNVYDSGFQLP